MAQGLSYTTSTAASFYRKGKRSAYSKKVSGAFLLSAKTYFYKVITTSHVYACPRRSPKKSLPAAICRSQS